MKKAKLEKQVTKLVEQLELSSRLDLAHVQLAEFARWGLRGTAFGLLVVIVVTVIVWWGGNYFPIQIINSGQTYMQGCIVIAHLAWIMLVGGFALQETGQVGDVVYNTSNKGATTIILAIGGVFVSALAMLILAGKISLIPMVLLIALQTAVFLLPSASLAEQGKYLAPRIATIWWLLLLALWVVVMSGGW